MDPSLTQQLILEAGDLDDLWNKFLVENDAILGVLLELDKLDEFSQKLELDLRALVYEVKVLVNDLCKANYAMSVPESSRSAIKSQVGVTDAAESTQSDVPTTPNAWYPPPL